MNACPQNTAKSGAKFKQALASQLPRYERKRARKRRKARGGAKANLYD